MTNTPVQTSEIQEEALRKMLLLTAKYFPTGALISGDEKSSEIQPRDPKAAPTEAIHEINEVLRDIPLRDLVQAAISISPNGAPDERTINDKIPLMLTGVSLDADFRVQWNPAGPLYVLDPQGPTHQDQFFIRVVGKTSQ